MLERKRAIRFSAALSNLHTPGLPRRGQKQAAPPAVRGAPPAAPVRAAGATPAPGRGQAFRAAAVPADPPAQPSPRAHCDQAERAVIRPNGRRDYPSCSASPPSARSCTTEKITYVALDSPVPTPQPPAHQQVQDQDPGRAEAPPRPPRPAARPPADRAPPTNAGRSLVFQQNPRRVPRPPAEPFRVSHPPAPRARRARPHARMLACPCRQRQDVADQSHPGRTSSRLHAQPARPHQPTATTSSITGCRQHHHRRPHNTTPMTARTAHQQAQRRTTRATIHAGRLHAHSHTHTLTPWPTTQPPTNRPTTTAPVPPTRLILPPARQTSPCNAAEEAGVQQPGRSTTPTTTVLDGTAKAAQNYTTPICARPQHPHKMRS